MKGQWIGNYTGTTEGTIIVNIDERSTYYQGVTYLHQKNATLPGVAASFRTHNKDTDFQFRTEEILAIDSLTGMVAPWDSVKSRYPENIAFSKHADVIGSLRSKSLTLSWTTDIEATGTCVLPRSRADEPSELVPLNKEWKTFKVHVARLGGGQYLFRGQNKPWRLQTSFHRAGRADLIRFLREDVQVLHRHLSTRTRHVFNLQNPDENGAFFNLVQHHGYLTPLLDWTYSPYVAAFFAYRGISNKDAAAASPTKKVRIHVFDQASWREDWKQPLQLLSVWPYFSIGEFIGIENERMIPQQAASTLTNVDDIESYIKDKESTKGKKYLSAIDLPVCERKKVIHELSYMGITAGSLFPGLDGACEELRERNFEL